ncbi:CPSF A subunit region-domain-containing protein [Roridomyces roridus]|uniref:CPSF A subunit region-domain-containing protein n=1 Tax=Roridomyces roridus TaxID=1738132 RepID=A0AAD7FYK5_9AGAR|nr:CPSF A subunit region-domain-containing protein [Roridomyces roridus]
MKVISTFHQPSSVLSSVKCNLDSSDVQHLVVAKINSLDVYSINPEGLKQICSWAVWGNILSVKAVPTGASHSNLIVLLDHPHPELVFLSYSNGVLSVTKRLELFERNQRPAEFFTDVLVHPSGKCAVAMCYTGKLKGIYLKAGLFEGDFDMSMRELTVLSLAFLPSSRPAIAILHYDHTGRVQLLARDILETDISTNPSALLHPTPIATKVLPYPEDPVPKLIPVPCPEAFLHVKGGDGEEDDSQWFIGGLLLVGGTRILLYEMVSARGQAKQSNKRRKLEKGKESGDKAEQEKAAEKQRERDTRKRKPKAAVDWPWSEITSFCALDGEPFRYLIGDSFGRLAMLSLHDVPNNGLILIPLGQTSPSTTLSYLTSQVLFVGSHAGDSQLVQISSNPLSSSNDPTLPIPSDITTVPASRLTPPRSAKGKAREEYSEPLRDCVLDVKGPFLRVIQTFKNIAPILDATLVDTDDSGHQQVVTCSGGQNTGSINVIRKGADFQQLATVHGMPHTVGVFALRRTYDDIFDSYLLVSTPQDTYAYEIKGEDALEQTESIGDASFAQGRTLAARNVQKIKIIPAVRRGPAIITPEKTEYHDTALVVQVTSNGAFLLESEMNTFTQVNDYKVPQGTQIVAASINPSQTVLALNNGKLVCLEVNGSTKALDVKRQSDTILGHREVSALSCLPLHSRLSTSDLIVVAYWQSNVVQMLQQAQDGFVSLCKTESLPAVVRSLLLYDFGAYGDSHPYLMAGLGDGSFAYFTWNDQGRTLGAAKLTSLGNLPVGFTPCLVDGKRALFAAGSRAVVLSWDRDGLQQSPVMLKEVTASAQIHSEHYESSLILANESALFIGRVKNVDKMHIRSIPLDLDVPHRIVYAPALKVFGVACTRQEPTRVGELELGPTSSFRLLDDVTFNNISQFNCEPDEEVTCVTIITLEQDDGESTPFFCVGTCTSGSEEKIPGNGRLLIFSAYPTEASRSNPQLALAASADVHGCVYAVTTVKGLIAIGVNSATMLFRLDINPSSKTCKLQKVSEMNHNYFVTSLVGYENRLLLGDRISSISVLEVSDDYKLQTLGKDLSPLGPVSLEAVDLNHLIVANDTLNLISFTFDKATRKLDRDGFYQQADLINKFVRGAVATPDAGSKFAPIQLFFTASGRIGVITDITDRQLSLDLTDLQRNIVNTTEGGHMHTTFRTPQTSARRRMVENAFGFLDGDLLEEVLTASAAQLSRIAEGTNEHERLKRPVEEFQQLLKTLQALH